MTTRLHPHQHDRYRRMPRYFWLFAALQLLAALLLDSPGNILRGLRTIVYTEDALITDYIAVAGPPCATPPWSPPSPCACSISPTRPLTAPPSWRWG